MIGVRLTGGLGNQMFQYAAGRALANRLGTELVLDNRDFERYKLYGYGLDKFAISATVATPEQLLKWPVWTRRAARILRQLNIRTSWYKESHFHYDSAWESIPDNSIIEGYFQSERYFSDVANILRHEFVPLRPLVSRNMNYSQQARQSESVMLHVRRGDYVANVNTLKVHGVCSVEYYLEAIKIIREKLDCPRFFVFSNDINWARENLPLGEDGVFVEGNGESPEIDLYLMSQCRHHIVANSSFSWWGAWLGSCENKIVIAPTPWFDDFEIKTQDLLPYSWLKIKK